MEAERELCGRWDLQTGASTTSRMCGSRTFINDLQEPFGRLYLEAGTRTVSLVCFKMVSSGVPGGCLGVGLAGDCRKGHTFGWWSRIRLSFRGHFGVGCTEGIRCLPQPQQCSGSLAL